MPKTIRLTITRCQDTHGRPQVHIEVTSPRDAPGDLSALVHVERDHSVGTVVDTVALRVALREAFDELVGSLAEYMNGELR